MKRSAVPIRVFAPHDPAVRQGVKMMAEGMVRCFLLRRGIIRRMSPREVIDKYLDLTVEDQKEVIRALGGMLRAEAIYGMMLEMNIAERLRLQDLLFEDLAGAYFLTLIQQARQIAKEMQGLPDEEFAQTVLERFSKSQEEIRQSIRETEATKLKAARDRKPDLEIAKRNIEICDLRRQDKRHWSQGRLAKKYDLDQRTIRKILKEELTWRRIVAGTGPTS